MAKKPNRYQEIIASIFEDHWQEDEDSFIFAREEIVDKAAKLNLDPPKNIGDLTYFFRYRGNLPESILATQPDGLEWIIEGAGHSKYQFRLVKISRIAPNEDSHLANFIDRKLCCRPAAGTKSQHVLYRENGTIFAASIRRARQRITRL